MSKKCEPGSIVMWGGTLSNVPSGFLHCDGSAVKRSDYHDLFKAIGFSFGDPSPKGIDPAKEFFLPDLRGRFIRGVDGGAGRDPDSAKRTDMQTPSITVGPVVGSIQSHAFQNHVHAYNSFPDGRGDIASGDYWQNGQQNTALANASTYQTSTETRPINAYLYFIICCE